VDTPTQGAVNNESAAAGVRADATIAGEVHVQLTSQKQGVKGQDGKEKVRFRRHTAAGLTSLLQQPGHVCCWYHGCSAVSYAQQCTGKIATVTLAPTAHPCSHCLPAGHV
jgi:hypothetical protein